MATSTSTTYSMTVTVSGTVTLSQWPVQNGGTRTETASFSKTFTISGKPGTYAFVTYGGKPYIGEASLSGYSSKFTNLPVVKVCLNTSYTTIQAISAANVQGATCTTVPASSSGGTASAPQGLSSSVSYSSSTTVTETYTHQIVVGTGGSGSTQTSKITYVNGVFSSGYAVSYTASPYSADYYFSGWSGGDAYVSGTSCTIPADVRSDVTVYANFAATQYYSVQFIGYNWDESEYYYPVQGVKAGSSATAPNRYDTQHYTDAGWDSNDWQNVQKDLVVRQWLMPRNYSVVFHGNNGSRPDGSTTYSTSVQYKGTTSAPTDFYLRGWYITGWYSSTDSSASRVDTNGSVYVTGDLNAYAWWSPGTYDLYTDANGGSYGGVSGVKKWDGYLVFWKYDSSYAYRGTASVPGNDSNVRFTGWYESVSGRKVYDADGNVVLNSSDSLWYFARNTDGNIVYNNAGDLSIKAGYERYRWTLVLDIQTDGVENETWSYVPEKGCNAFGISVPSRNGSTFIGWYDAKTGGNKVFGADGSACEGTYFANGKLLGFGESSSTFTLYARWSSNTFTVKRFKAFRSGPDDSETRDSGQTYTFACGSSIGLSRSTDVDSKYEFIGWSVGGADFDYDNGRWGEIGNENKAFPKIGVFSTGNSFSARDVCSKKDGVVEFVENYRWKKRNVVIEVPEAESGTTWGDYGGWDASVDGVSCSVTKADGKSSVSFSAHVDKSYTVKLVARSASVEGDEYRVPYKLGSDEFDRAASVNGLPAWSRSFTVSSGSSSDVVLSVSTLKASATRSIDSRIKTDAAIGTWTMYGTSARSVTCVANTDIKGAEFVSWNAGESSFSSASYTFQIGSSDVTGTATYGLGKVKLFLDVDAKSLENGCQKAWIGAKVKNGNSYSEIVFPNGSGERFAEVTFGSAIVLECNVTSASNASRPFSCWHFPDLDSRSEYAVHTIPSVEDDIVVKAMFKVPFTLSKSLYSEDSGTELSAALVFNGESSYAETVNGYVEIGGTASFGVTPIKGVFAGWYSATDNTFSTPLGHAASDTITVDGPTNIVARVLDKALVNYVAVYNVDENGYVEGGNDVENGNIPFAKGRLGTILVDGEDLKEITKSEYETVCGTSDGRGWFFRIRQGSSFTIKATMASEAEYIGMDASVNGGAYSEKATSRNRMPAFISNGNAVYRVKWGVVSYQPIIVRYSKKNNVVVGRARPGYDAIKTYVDESTSDCRAYGVYEKSSTITLIAQASNGYRFLGWKKEKQDGEEIRFSSSMSPGDGSQTQQNEYVSKNNVFTFTSSEHGPAEGDTAICFRAEFALEKSVSLHRWEGGSARKNMKWRSKTYVLSRPANLTSIRVDAEKYPVSSVGVASYSSPDTDARVTHEITLSSSSGISDQTMRRLPPRRPERYFQVEVQNNAEVDAVFIGTSGPGLAT